MTVDEDLLYRLVGERLREQRTAVGLTQAVLANRAEVLRTSITNIEKGLQKAPLHVLYRLCDALEMDIASALPQIPQVKRSPFVSVQLEGTAALMPPRAAEFVERLREEDDTQ